MSGNLLVVDWDYFFPNPLEATIKGRQDDAMMYDWGHRESRFFIDMIWGTRAASFFMHDMKLPTMEPSWKSFSDRFTLSEDAVIYVADSNMWAGNIESQDGEPFEDVWLYDAHHDAGYDAKSFTEWLAKHRAEGGGISFSCEDWMLIHYMQGTTLHWRFPTWHDHFKKCLEEGTLQKTWPADVLIDARVDDLQPLDAEIDVVFICRSGAWVPPWEDGKFKQFTESWDRDIEQLDDVNLVREFDLEEAQAQAVWLKQQMAARQSR